MGIILTEDDVVDIVASRDIQRILIEVKGGTTSIEGINSVFYNWKRLTFVYKIGFTDNIVESKFKSPRKNEKNLKMM